MSGKKPHKICVGIVSKTERVKELVTKIYDLGFNPFNLGDKPSNIGSNIEVVFVQPLSTTPQGVNYVKLFHKEQRLLEEAGKPFVQVYYSDVNKFIIETLTYFKTHKSWPPQLDPSASPATPAVVVAPPPPRISYKTAALAIEAFVTHFGCFSTIFFSPDFWANDTELLQWLSAQTKLTLSTNAPRVLEAMRDHTKGSLRLAATKIVKERTLPNFPLYKKEGNGHYDVICANPSLATNYKFKQELITKTNMSLNPMDKQAEPIAPEVPPVEVDPEGMNITEVKVQPSSNPEPSVPSVAVVAPVAPVAQVAIPASAPVNVKPRNMQEELDTLLVMLSAQLREMNLTSYIGNGLQIATLPVHLKTRMGGYACGLSTLTQAKPVLGAVAATTVPTLLSDTKLSAITCEDCKRSEFYLQAMWILEQNS